VPPLRAIAARLVPPHFGWMPFWSLIYLVFLAMPLVMPRAAAPGWALPTLLVVIAFVPLYFRGFNVVGRELMLIVVAMWALGVYLTPRNSFAYTLVIYACAFAPWIGSLRLGVGVAVVLVALFAANLGVFDLVSLFTLGVTMIIGTVCFATNYLLRENQAKQAALRLSHDEVRRLAATAERERIGRDLHDLLGHTLSLIALKTELATRLWERDSHAARREVEEVERVARDALAQVRRAVTGIRAAGIAAELASARLLLESSAVTFRYEADLRTLPPDVETGVALAVREAVTNIRRHARAVNATVRVAREAGALVVVVADDGRGGDIVPGNGLTGMRERLAGVGATLQIDSIRGHGTMLTIRVPLPADDGADAAGFPLQVN